MPASKSTSRGPRAASGDGVGATSGGSGAAKTSRRPARGSEGLSSVAEQVMSRIIKPLGLVVLSTERIHEVLDDAAERGRLTRSDADHLAGELVKRGRQQTDQLLSDLERLLDRGRQGSAAVRARWTDSMDLLGRSADRARRTVGVGQSFPILGYDDLTAAQVQARLQGLSPAELRKIREYERRHANRKSVLSAIEKSLTSR